MFRESFEKKFIVAQIDKHPTPWLVSVAFSNLAPPFGNVLFSQAVVIPASAVLAFKASKRESLGLRQTDKVPAIAIRK